DEDSITAREFVDALNALSVKRVTVRLNSYGGSVSDALAIYNAMRRHEAKVIVAIDGVAVSSASLIAMAGDEVEMAENGLLMIHAPWSMAVGNASELREVADVLDRYAEAMRTAYAAKTGKSTDETLALLTDGLDHWYGSAEAKAENFVDTITGEAELPAAASLRRFTARMPLQIAAQFRGTIMKPNTTTAPGATSKPTLTPVIESEVHARLRQRNADITMRFQPFMAHAGVREIFDAAIANPEGSAQNASDKLLAHLGSQCEPLGGNPRIDISGGVGLGDFIAAASDALLLRGGLRVKQPNPDAQSFRRMSILNMAEECLGRNGVSTQSFGPERLVRAGLSTSDHPPLRLARLAITISGYPLRASDPKM
ncbi:MAG: head maturation protease, ClpP-related, partial [Gammaproteobacteria bacterium]